MNQRMFIVTTTSIVHFLFDWLQLFGESANVERNCVKHLISFLRAAFPIKARGSDLFEYLVHNLGSNNERMLLLLIITSIIVICTFILIIIFLRQRWHGDEVP